MAILIEYTSPNWRNLNMRELQVDEAYINFETHYTDSKTYFYIHSDACYTCPFTKLTTLIDALPDKHGVEERVNLVPKNKIFAINVAHSLNFKIFDHDVGNYAFDNSTPLCTIKRHDLEEFGVYNVTLEANGTCSFIIDKPGVNIYYPMIFVMLLFAIFVLLFGLKRIIFHHFSNNSPIDIVTHVRDDARAVETRKRIYSLDTFRGLAIVLMIFVNSGGGKYWWIEHATWNGLHLADIVFPSFLWIMGVCIPQSIKIQLNAINTNKLKVCRRILWRSIKLFIIGVCLNSINGPKLEQLRIMGVLQRFGIAFLVCGTLRTIFNKRNHVIQQATYDMWLFGGEFLVLLGLIIIHIIIVFGMNVPDCPRGYLGPGGKHANATYPNCIGGATGYIDKLILGAAHIYQHPTAKYVYDSQPFDPEGVFGCLLTVVHVLIGVFAGVTLLVYTDWIALIKRWLIWSIIFGVLGVLLCGFSKENGLIPVNKNLWSLSFVFITVSWAFATLAVLYVIIDVKQRWNGYPFAAAGKNAIIMYVGHTIMHKMLPWHWRVGAMNTHIVLLIEALWNTCIWIGIAIYLDGKKFYYRL